MKTLTFLAAFIMCGVAAFAENSTSAAQPLIDWNLLLSGSWEESKTLHNRGEIKLNILPLNLMLRGQVLDRRTLNFELDNPWGDPDKWITNYTASLYHRPTGSRILYGVLDEWGLPARIRNPWIRSPPYTENHRPIITDVRTAVSSTREDQVYLYLSSPFIELFPNLKLKGFISGQTEIDDFTPAISGGLDLSFSKNTRLLLETFYTGKTLPAKKISTWFSDPPVLPEREFNLYAAGILFTCPFLSISSDFAISDTFFWGTDIYTNLGITITPLLPIGARARPLAISLAADGSGERFVNRDGSNLSEGFRTAAKIEWRSRYNSLLRIDTVLRAPAFGEDFNRSSTGFYYRFPSSARINRNFFRLTRISFSADRNAVNPQKINDSFSGYLGLRINLSQFGANNFLISNPIGINFSGSVKGLTSSDNPSPFPIINDQWNLDNVSLSCELIWSAGIFQIRSKTGYEFKEEKWDFSINASSRFKQGRLSLKAASPDFPEKWNFTVSWRLEI